jgi:hypothetical protein
MVGGGMIDGMEMPRGRWWGRVRMDAEDREFYVLRLLLVVVAGPTGALLAGAAMALEDGEQWWPWLGGAILWLLGTGAVTVAVWWRMANRLRR